MPSVTVWSCSDAGSISLTATLSFTDHLTLLLSGLARHVTESVNLTGMSSQNISPSIATHPHALTSHPTPFMSIKTSTLPMLTHRAHSFFWRPQRKAPMAVPPSTKGCSQSDSFSTHKPHFFLTTSLAAKRDLGVASQGEIHLCTSSTPDRSTGRFEAMPHSFVWPLKRVPLLNCHVDHDRPSLVCPSPRYREFRPKIAFSSPFWRPSFSIDNVQPLPLSCILLHDGA